MLTRDQLLQRVWGYSFDVQTNVVDVFVGYLRRKLEAEGAPRLLHTVRGVGFALLPPGAGRAGRCLALALSLVLAGALLVSAVAREARAAVDAELEARAERVERAARGGPGRGGGPPTAPGDARARSTVTQTPTFAHASHLRAPPRAKPGAA